MVKPFHAIEKGLQTITIRGALFISTINTTAITIIIIFII